MKIAPGHEMTMERPGLHQPRSPYRVMVCSCGERSGPLLAAHDRKRWREDHAAALQEEAEAMSLMDDDLFEPAYYSDEPDLNDDPDYSDTPKRARLMPCPHRHLFGIPNGMSRKQLEEHSRKCVFIGGKAYTVEVDDE